MASQSRIIACGTKMTMVAMALKFIIGPAIMALAARAMGLKDILFKVTIIQVIFFLKIAKCKELFSHTGFTLVRRVTYTNCGSYRHRHLSKKTIIFIVYTHSPSQNSK